jgi:hypothetical protein
MDRTEVSFSEHAIVRFRERCRPALSSAAAGIELERVAAHGRIVRTAPDWHALGAAQTAEAYLLLGDDIILPLVRIGGSQWLAKTCLTRKSMSAAARARRNDRKARSRAARRVRRSRPRLRLNGLRVLPTVGGSIGL